MCYLTCKRSRAVDRSRERGDSQLWLLQATHSRTRRQAGAVNWFLPGMWMIPLRSDGLALAATGRRVFPCKCYALPTVADSVDGQGYRLNWLPTGTVPACSTRSVRSFPGWPLLMHIRDHPRGVAVSNPPALARTIGPAGIRIQARTPRTGTH